MMKISVPREVKLLTGPAPTGQGSLWRSPDEALGKVSPAKNGAEGVLQWHSEPVSAERRDFLRLLSASLALAGAAGCSRQPEQTILPYVRAPEALTPTQPLFFATAANFGHGAVGLLVQSNMGRPTKVEGNPLHPESRGATDIFSQASVLDVWDPDRSQSLTHRGQIATWDDFFEALTGRRNQLATAQGAGLRILTESVFSPTLTDQIRTILARFPGARWHQYQPVSMDNAYEGTRIAFGETLEPHYQFERCRVVLSLDCDFLGGPRVRMARDLAAGRRTEGNAPEPGRLYVAEATPSLTGAFADHRLAIPSSQVAALTWTIANALGLPVAAPDLSTTIIRPGWISSCVQDLKQNRGRSLIVAGDAQPPLVHALVHAINHALGNTDATVHFATPANSAVAPQAESLAALVEAIRARRVDTLILLGGNPVYNAPADMDFDRHLGTVPWSAHLSVYNDETSARCHWHIPRAHFLESWSDTRASDGTVSLQQPLMAPLYGGKSEHELLAALLGPKAASDYQSVREYWKAERQGPDFEEFWNGALQRGVIDGTSFPRKDVRLRTDWMADLPAGSRPVAGPELELVFAPDPTIWDGRQANNGWLQELPKPLTKLTWDNAALIAPSLAKRLDLRNEDVVELRYQGRSLTAPVWILPGHADGAVTLTLGYGRSRAGRVGNGVGVNAFLLRSSDAPWFGTGLEIRKTAAHHPLATTQHHHTMEGRRPVVSMTYADFQLDPSALMRGVEPPNVSMYEPRKYAGYAWAMSINLDACVGCSACTIACQAENNIPIVGKTEVRRGREMHWMRVDRYFEGAIDAPRTYFQPVPCMHCEHAPCEAVCPVEATVHDSEGLNLQVYNRCVGTRFCSNNCPYKVRRFNFLQYADLTEENLKAQRNPEVTVRMRGVMEKCTYCVQRIANARIEAEKANRRLGDGEVLTACQAVCPTGAIVFGDLNDPTSKVNQAKRSQLSYELLAELNTRPRTTYLAKLTNPHPGLDQV